MWKRKIGSYIGNLLQHATQHSPPMLIHYWFYNTSFHNSHPLNSPWSCDQTSVSFGHVIKAHPEVWIQHKHVTMTDPTSIPMFFPVVTQSLFFSPLGSCYMGVQPIQKSTPYFKSCHIFASYTYVPQCFSLLSLPLSHCFSLFQFSRLSLHRGTRCSKINTIFGIARHFCI